MLRCFTSMYAFFMPLFTNMMLDKVSSYIVYNPSKVISTCYWPILCPGEGVLMSTNCWSWEKYSLGGREDEYSLEGGGVTIILVGERRGTLGGRGRGTLLVGFSLEGGGILSWGEEYSLEGEEHSLGGRGRGTLLKGLEYSLVPYLCLSSFSTLLNFKADQLVPKIVTTTISSLN